MTFPKTSVLDRFNRADAATLGPNYSVVAGYNGLGVVANHAALVSSPAFQVWSKRRYLSNQQVWVMVENALSSSMLWLAFRCPSTQPTDGYRCEIAQEPATIIARLYRISTDEEIGTPISFGISSLNAGDLIGIDATGYRYTLYYRPVGAAAIALGQWYDTNVGGCGYIGLGAYEIGDWFLGPWPEHPSTPPIAPGVVDVVYQPKFYAGIYSRSDAPNYANGLLNIINPGTYDAYEGIAPTFNAASGWSSTGTQYLKTGWVAGDQDHAIFVSFSNADPLQPCEVTGAISGTGVTTAIEPVNGANKDWANCSTFAFTQNPGILTEGTFGYSARRAFANGSYVLTLPLSAQVQTVEQYVMSWNNNGAPFGLPTVTVHAVVFLNSAITDVQVAALCWALDRIRTA